MNGSLVGSGSLSKPDTTLTGFEWGVNSDPGTDTGFIDNISITSSAVPEPSSVLMIGIGAMALTAYVRPRRPKTGCAMG
jgi:hypothetical protein